MNAISVRHCPYCQAMVNIHWPACLACHARLSQEPSGVVVPPAALYEPGQASKRNRGHVDAPVSIEPAMKPGGSPLSPVYWETADTRIVGPAMPEYVVKVGTGLTAEFWVIVSHEGTPRWVHSNRLRSKKQFETQRPVTVVDFVKDLR